MWRFQTAVRSAALLSANRAPLRFGGTGRTGVQCTGALGTVVLLAKMRCTELRAKVRCTVLLAEVRCTVARRLWALRLGRRDGGCLGGGQNKKAGTGPAFCCVVLGQGIACACSRLAKTLVTEFGRPQIVVGLGDAGVLLIAC